MYVTILMFNTNTYQLKSHPVDTPPRAREDRRHTAYPRTRLLLPRIPRDRYQVPGERLGERVDLGGTG